MDQHPLSVGSGFGSPGNPSVVGATEGFSSVYGRLRVVLVLSDKRQFVHTFIGPVLWGVALLFLRHSVSRSITNHSSVKSRAVLWLAGIVRGAVGQSNCVFYPSFWVDGPVPYRSDPLIYLHFCRLPGLCLDLTVDC